MKILNNSIDEAREGYGERIVITRFADHSVEVEDFGRGIPVDYNQKEEALQLGALSFASFTPEENIIRRRARVMNLVRINRLGSLCHSSIPPNLWM